MKILKKINLTEPAKLPYILGIEIAIVLVLAAGFLYYVHSPKKHQQIAVSQGVFGNTCRLDFAAERDTYSIWSKDPSTRETLLKTMKKMGSSESWAVGIETQGNAYVAVRLPWKQLKDRTVVYETYIKKCDSIQDVDEQILVFQNICTTYNIPLKVVKRLKE